MKKLIVAAALVAALPVAAQDRVLKYDMDGDRKVSYEELTAKCEVRQSLFNTADKNSDGYLDNSEMRTARAYLFNKCNKE